MERAIGEIFYDGNVKLVVQRAVNSISCKGCYYNQYIVRSHYSCKTPKMQQNCKNLPGRSCSQCNNAKSEVTRSYECRRNFIAAGICQASFRDDGESVVFAEVCE